MQDGLRFIAILSRSSVVEETERWKDNGRRLLALVVSSGKTATSVLYFIKIRVICGIQLKIDVMAAGKSGLSTQGNRILGHLRRFKVQAREAHKEIFL